MGTIYDLVSSCIFLSLSTCHFFDHTPQVTFFGTSCRTCSSASSGPTWANRHSIIFRFGNWLMWAPPPRWHRYHSIFVQKMVYHGIPTGIPQNEDVTDETWSNIKLEGSSVVLFSDKPIVYDSSFPRINQHERLMLGSWFLLEVELDYVMLMRACRHASQIACSSAAVGVAIDLRRSQFLGSFALTLVTCCSFA